MVPPEAIREASVSITVSTDIVCDVCHDWIHGTSGPRSNAKEARRVAKRKGWRRTTIDGTKVDVCPKCRRAGVT